MPVERFPRVSEQLARYRKMHDETTDPLALRLLGDIILDLEAELRSDEQAAFGDTAAHLRN
jgi:hypothetical protein